MAFQNDVPHLGLTLAVVLAQSGRMAVLSFAADRTEPPAEGPLASALLSEGLPVIAGPALRDRLLGDARPLGHELSRTIDQAISAAQEGYDRGDFGASARQAGLAFEALARAAPSKQREGLIDEVQVLWCAALLKLKGRSAAAAHFSDALQRNPELVIDKDRFAPPVQRQFEEERSRVVNGPQVSLEVSGTAGAILFIDGTPRGSLPLRIALAPHHCTVWVEVSGEPGLAHDLVLTHSTALAPLFIDWQLETALRFSDGDLVLELPAEPPASDFARRALLQRIMKKASAEALLALEWVTVETPSPAPGQARRLAVVRYAKDGSERGPRAASSRRRRLAAGGARSP